MKERYKIVNEEVRANCLSKVSQIKPEDKMTVIIMDEQESRSAAQSRLRWVWAGQAAKELNGVGKGRNKDQWNLFWKHRFMRPLLISQDEDFVIFFMNYDDHCELLENNPLVLQNYQHEFWELIAQTEKMNVKTFAEFLSDVYEYMLSKYNILLHVPSDLEFAR
jgi:hypothetical protein